MLERAGTKICWSHSEHKKSCSYADAWVTDHKAVKGHCPLHLT